MPVTVNTGRKLKLIETDDINKVSFEDGQYIIMDDGGVYYDPTTGASVEDRICLNPSQSINTYERTNDYTDLYYLELQTKPINGDMIIIKDLIPNTTKYAFTIYLYNTNESDNNEASWLKLTSSYDADDVYIDKDIIFVQSDEEAEFGIKRINLKGKSLSESLIELAGEDEEPIITPPSAITTANFEWIEAGPTVNIRCETQISFGEYEFGPEVLCEVPNYDLYETTHYNGYSYGDFGNQATGTLSINNDGNTCIITGNKDYPCINPGQLSVDSSLIIRYISKPLTKHGVDLSLPKRVRLLSTAAKIGVYYNLMYYGSSSNTLSLSDLELGGARSYNNAGRIYGPYEYEDVEVRIPIGTKSFFIAIYNNTAVLNRVHVYNVTAGCDMTDAFDFINSDISTINAASDLVSADYRISIYTPTEPFEKETKLKIYFER